jgi:exodeoxyribonuclease-3
MIFTSWNVNGLRSVSTKGFKVWMDHYLPDVIALQEIKALESDVQHLISEWTDLYDTHLFSAVKKGYSGTALLIKKQAKQKALLISRGLDRSHFDSEGRLIWVEFENLIFINGYFPNGQRDHSRVDYKLEFSRAVVSLAKDLMKKTGKGVFIAGDINTAHAEIDLANPKANAKTTGFLPQERAFVTEMIQAGFTDVFRHFNPGVPGCYTWWTYRGDCRERNIGWRLDYFFSSNNLLDRIKSIEHQTLVTGSDHCPVLMEIH